MPKDNEDNVGYIVRAKFRAVTRRKIVARCVAYNEFKAIEAFCALVVFSIPPIRFTVIIIGIRIGTNGMQ